MPLIIMGLKVKIKKLHPPKSVRMQFLIDQIILMGLLITTIKQVIYPGDKLVKVEWLCEIVICAKGSCFAVANIHGGDDQDRRFGKTWVGAQHGTQFKTIRRRHHQVKDKEVGIYRMCRLHGL